MVIGKVKIWQIGSILRMIYKNPNITRMEISNSLSINKSMITRLINDLIKEGWISHSNSNTQKIPLTLNKKRVVTAGIEIQPHFQSVVICNVTGEIIYQKKWDEKLENFEAFLNGPVLDILNNSTVTIQAVGIALPGIYNRKSNQIVCSIPFKLMSPVDLPPFLKNRDRPIFFDNDARCCGWGQIAFEREKDDFIFIMSDFDEYKEPSDEYKRINIGASIFIDQQAYTGSHCCAGEFRSVIHSKGNLSGQSYLSDSTKVKMKSDPVILEDFIEELAFHMGFMTDFLDIKKIYIGGSLEDYKTIVERLLRTKILENCIYPRYQKPDITYPDFDSFSIAKGAAGLAFERLFTEPLIENPNPFYKEITARIND